VEAHQLTILDRRVHVRRGFLVYVRVGTTRRRPRSYRPSRSESASMRWAISHSHCTIKRGTAELALRSVFGIHRQSDAQWQAASYAHEHDRCWWRQAAIRRRARCRSPRTASLLDTVVATRRRRRV